MSGNSGDSSPKEVRVRFTNGVKGFALGVLAAFLLFGAGIGVKHAAMEDHDDDASSSYSESGGDNDDRRGWHGDDDEKSERHDDDDDDDDRTDKDSETKPRPATAVTSVPAPSSAG